VVRWSGGQLPKDYNLRLEYMEYEGPEYVRTKLGYCDKCKGIDDGLLEWCNVKSSFGNAQYQKFLKMYIEHDPLTHIDTPLKKTERKGNGKPQGIFAGTLTMSDKDVLNENEMCFAISKIMTQQTVPVKRYAWYVERTENGLPHIHFIYETETGGRIHNKIFKRYWKIWDESVKIGKGHRGGYHKVVESETAYTEYIAKDGGRCINRWT